MKFKTNMKYMWKKSLVPYFPFDCTVKYTWHSTAGSRYVSEAFAKRCLHPKVHLLFNYFRLFKRWAGWLVAAAEAAPAQSLSVTCRHLIHSPDTRLGPRESNQSNIRTLHQTAEETLDSEDTAYFSIMHYFTQLGMTENLLISGWFFWHFSA